MMKYAIYYVTVGTKAFECLTLSLESLRKSGCTQNIYVLTTKKDEKDAEKIKHLAQPIYLSEEVLNLEEDLDTPLATLDIRRLRKDNPRNRKMGDKFTICHAKSIVAHQLPITEYDYILYLDSDILINKPWEEIDAYILAHADSIVTSTNRTRWLGEYPFFLSPLWFTYGTLTSNLTKLELFQNWHIQPLCADVIGFPTNTMGKTFLNEWFHECQKGIDSDQAALQAVLLRLFKKEHVLAPKSIFGYGPAARDYTPNTPTHYVDSALVHFHGAVRDKRAMQDYYDRHIKDK